MNDAEQEERRIQRRLEEERKSPKLVITKFDGTHFNWFRFCNEFESQIDEYDVPQVSKYSYD